MQLSKHKTWCFFSFFLDHRRSSHTLYSVSMCVDPFVSHIHWKRKETLSGKLWLLLFRYIFLLHRTHSRRPNSDKRQTNENTKIKILRVEISSMRHHECQQCVNGRSDRTIENGSRTMLFSSFQAWAMQQLGIFQRLQSKRELILLGILK